MASPGEAQRAPERDPLPEEISQVIVVTGRQTPEYTLKDGLRRIERVMEENRRLGVWKEAIGAFRYFDGGLCDADFAILRSRFQRICDMAWAHFNCHNFAETFRHRVTAELKDPRLDAVCRRIDAAYDLSHTRNWQLIALNDCRDWSSRRYNELEWGMCNCVIQCLEELCRSDEEVLNAIREARAVLER